MIKSVGGNIMDNQRKIASKILENFESKKEVKQDENSIKQGDSILEFYKKHYA